MKMIYESELEVAKDQAESNEKLMKKLKKLNPRRVDDLFHDNHYEVFEEVDCLSCANCCKTTSPIFRDIDIKRLAKRERMSIPQFISTYLRKDVDGDYVLQSSPCPFLMDDNKCIVYEDRPAACREFPHTNRKKMQQILPLTRTNSEVCPAVHRIINRIRRNFDI